MKICIVGLGYVGLPLLEAFYDRTEHDLIGFDVDHAKLEQRHFDQSRALFTCNETDLSMADVIIVCVPTGLKHGKPDYSHVESAARMIGAHVKDGALVVFESTYGPHTTVQRLKPLMTLRHSNFLLGYSPERINPGDKVYNLRNTVKLVAGETQEALERTSSLYNEIVDTIYECPLIEIAEASKCVENMHRDLNIAFVNQLCMNLSELGMSVNDVMSAASTKFNVPKLSPGMVGGHCLPCDGKFFFDTVPSEGMKNLIKRARAVNDSMIFEWLPDVIQEKIPEGQEILIYGYTYKPEIEDCRESGALKLAQRLEDLGYEIELLDPLINDRSRMSEYPFRNIIVCTGHAEIDWRLTRYLNKEFDCNVIDIPGCLDKNKVPKYVKYWRLGDC